MSRRPLGSLNGALLLMGIVASMGCGGSDALRVGIYDPSTAYASYGYGGSSAGASAWSGYAGVAPTVAAPPPERTLPSVPSLVLRVPRPGLSTAILGPGRETSALRLSAPALHTPRSEGWHRP